MEDLPARLRRCGTCRLLLTGSLPDETTIPNFHHLLERHGLGKTPFGEATAHLALLGHRRKTGMILDTNIIAAPSSTKSRRGRPAQGEPGHGGGLGNL